MKPKQQIRGSVKRKPGERRKDPNDNGASSSEHPNTEVVASVNGMICRKQQNPSFVCLIRFSACLRREYL